MDIQMSDTGQAFRNGVQELIAFRTGTQEFCVNVRSVREIRGWTPATSLPHAPGFVLGVINLRGIVLPIIDLATRLGFSPTEPTARHAIIVVECGRQAAGLLVEGVSDIFTVDEAQIQPTPDVASEAAKLFIRGVIATEGRLISIVDIDNILPAIELAA